MAATQKVTPNRRGARSRELVLNAAERVMAEQGHDRASINAIVEEAGIPISSVYHYFGSKDGVLLAVMERGADRFFAGLPEPDQRLGTPAEHLAAMLAAVAAALRQQPNFLQLLIVMTAQPPQGEESQVREVVGRIRAEALDRIRRQMRVAFDLDPRTKAADRLARFALATIDGAFIAQQGDAGVKFEQVLEHAPAALVALHDEISP